MPAARPQGGAVKGSGIVVRTVTNLIAGTWSESGGSIDDIPDPATGEVIAKLPYSSVEDIGRAIAAAREALPGWANTPPPARAQILFRLKQLLEEHMEEISAIITSENGKTLAESRGDVGRGIEVVDFACGAPTLLMGTNLDQIATGIDTELTRFPVGVVAGITPFNFPVMIPLWMIAPALACGNTFVLKPSQRTPLSPTRLGELIEEAGVPPGVLNIVHGAKESVDTLLTHPGIDAVSFVGSAPVARYVYENGSGSGKRVQALGGAKNHMIVMDDAELEPSLNAIISSAFGMAGQRCLAGSVAVGVGGVGEVLARELASVAENLKVGPGTDPETEMGPVIRDERRKELIGYIDEGVSTGASLIADGRGLAGERGFFLGATVFDGVTPDMRLWQDEMFGPILSVAATDDLDAALALSNRSPFGNAASIFTTSGKHARDFKRGIEAGMLGVNIGVAAPMAFLPFTGWKGSFFGDLHATGLDGIRFYTRHKVVTSRWF